MGDSRSTQLLAYVAAGVLLVVVGVRLLAGGDDEPAGRAARIAVEGPADGRGAGDGHGDRQLYVHVAGAVRRPGLYRVAAGARIAAAIERAGGLTRRAEVAAINLAAPLEDGQQVLVPTRGAGVPAAGTSGGAPGTGRAGAPGAGNGGGAPISLASATAEQLDALDGIGPKLAARIIEYRDAHGGFRSIDELREVEGIGEKRFEALRGAVRP